MFFKSKSLMTGGFILLSSFLMLIALSCYEDNSSVTKVNIVFDGSNLKSMGYEKSTIEQKGVVAPSEIDNITLAVTGNGVNMSLQNIDITTGSITLNISSGENRKFEVKAYNEQGELIYSGIKIVNLKAGATENLFVVMSVVTYILTYDINGATNGQSAPASEVHNYDDGIGVPPNDGDFTKPGFKSNGWNTTADGSGTRYVFNEGVNFNMPRNDVTLYVHWQVIGVP